MSTPRKRRRVDDDGGQEEAESRDELRLRSSTSSGPVSGAPPAQFDPTSPKKRSLHERPSPDDDTLHQFAPGAPPLTTHLSHTPAKNVMRNPPRSPGPGFITSSPMNKKTPKSNAAATRNTKKLKPIRRLSDEFEQMAQDTPSPASADSSETASKPSSDLPSNVESDHTLHTDADDAGHSQSTKPIDSSTHSRHASLNNPHGDQIDENNTSIMNSIFSPGLRSYVTKKFHALTSSLGVRSSQEIERDGTTSLSSSSSQIGHAPHQAQTTGNASSAPTHPRSHIPLPDFSHSSKAQLPSANGIHHAAYRKRPSHGLSSADNSSSQASSSAHAGASQGEHASEDLNTSRSSSHLGREGLKESKDRLDSETDLLGAPSASSAGEHKNGDAKAATSEDKKSKASGEAESHTRSRRSTTSTPVSSPGPKHRKKARSRIAMVEEKPEEVEEEDELVEPTREEVVEPVELIPELVEEVEEVEEGEEEIADDVSEEEFDSYLFMANVPPLANLGMPAVPQPSLPLKSRHAPKVTLVLDLDETLVHCSLEKIDNPDLIFSVPFEGEEYQVYVRKRPGFEEFLSRVSELFEVAVFTASQKAYADKLLNILDPGRRWIHHRLFRESCVFVLGNYLKDLNVLNRELAKVIIVDNSPHVFAYQIDNGIPIESWYEDSRDRELLNLLPFLETLASSHDVRPLIRGRFQVHKKVEESLRAYQDITSLAKAKHLLLNDNDLSEDSATIVNERNSSVVENDSDDDQRTTPVKPSRRKSRVRSRISIAQYDTDEDQETTAASPKRSKR